MKMRLSNRLLVQIVSHGEEQTAVPQTSRVLFLLEYFYKYRHDPAFDG